MDREPLEDERVEQPPAALALIATGVMTRTREQARHEVQQREASLRAAATAARRKPGSEPPLRADKTDTTDPETAFAMSPRFATDAAIRELQQRPAVAFVVQNAAKQDDLSAPSNTAPQPPVAKDAAVAALGREKRQTWFSPVHVPLAHRKLVESPRVFSGIAPSKPSSGRVSVESPNQNSSTSSSRGRVPRVATLQSASNRGGGGEPYTRRRTVDRHFLDSLRARNQELYDKLVARFSPAKRIEEARRVSHIIQPEKNPSDDDAVAGVTTVEDAVLFFLHEKHAHDVLYFKRRTEARTHSGHTRAVSDVPVSMSFSASARIDDTTRYTPYDLERIAAPPELGASDFFIMSSTALVHHASSSTKEVVGEAIPIAQWVMESKMFSLLLAGIPLFQKFLLRKVFVWWAMEARKLVFLDLKKRIARTLPLARRSFVRPLLTSFETLRRVQHVQALTLPVKHLAAVQLAALHEHHRTKLSEAETKLIDAKEELLQLMDTMVHDIQGCTTPSTQLDQLYSTEVSEIHMVNPKWKSAPIKALRRHRESITSQVETAKMDLSLLAKYVRLMEYMFTESVYLMLLGSIRHLTIELRREDYSGAISASVAIVGDDLVLSPSALETKNVLLEGIARLIRLAGNFHFTKNAIAWSTNRGSGSLTLVSSAFSSDAIASQFDLQEVLRRDDEFKIVSARLIEEVSNCFDDAAHQMKAFESLKPIYAAVQSVSRDETRRNLQISRTNVQTESTVELQSVVGISGGELARYLRTLSHRLSVLDRSQHACQKIQSSWKVGFLEIQCRRSVTEILELITQEREMLHKHVLGLATQGTNDCLTAIQKASLVYEDRPQLIEYFCAQLKQVKVIKDQEKQLHQDIRNVDEIVRALKRYAPDLMSDGTVQYSVLHAIYTRYGVLSQSHDKFVSKMLPNITQQVSNALQRYTVRCQRLLRVYEENVDIATEEELERNIGTFQDIHREIRSIEDATRLYHDYQKMVGMKVMEITMLGEVREHWDEVQDVVTFTIQWKAATRLMESGIFGEQPWRLHLDTVNVFLSRIETIQENRTRSFAAKLLDRLRAAISDYQRRLELVIEMAQPYVKPHHWQQIMALLDIVNYVSTSGVVRSDGSTLTLGFLQRRSLWKFEGHIRDITVKARNDSVTESKMEDMKRRLYAAILPIVKIGDVYELEATGTTRLLTQFENDLVTVQTLSQLTSSAQLSTSLAQWADDIGNYQDILESWVAVQGDWKRLDLIFGRHDVQQVVVDATYEFQALDRKWRAMMTAAKGSSSLAVCLREVMSRAFLATCAATSEQLWKELGNYLSEKRHYFPRLYFVSDRDLLHIIASSKHPTRLSRLISKCFQEIHSLKISRGDIPHRRREGSRFTQEGTLTDVSPDDSDSQAQDYLDDDVAVTLFEIVGIVGVSSDEELDINPMRVSSSPEIWMRDLSNRIQEGIKEAMCFTMDGTLTSLYDGHFADLLKPRNESRSHSLARHTSKTLDVSPSSWLASPLHVIILCINVLLTSELTPLVCADRSGAEWNAFWDGYRAKKENLAAFVRQRNITSRERIVGSSIIVMMMNKQSGIEDLYHDQTIQTTSSSFTSQHHQDTTAIHYNYANGSSFSWTKIMRFYFEPFDKKCVIHHCVKSHEYGNSFIGGYTCPVLTPLSDRVILAMNVAVSLEVGAVLYSPSAQCVGKRTLLTELATSIGNEVGPFSFGTAVMLSRFFRLLCGALQSEACWVEIRGLESRADMNTIRVMAGEISRLRDALRGGQDVISIDGVSVNVANSRVGIFVFIAPNMHQDADHQELLLRMSHALMPIACHRPDEARMAHVSLAASGMKDAGTLSRKLAALLSRLNHSPIALFSSSVTVQQLMHVVKRAASKHLRNPWKSEEKCLVISLWEEIGTNVIPEQRVAVVNFVRSIFASAKELEISPLGLLATPTAKMHRDISKQADSIETDDELAYDSDEEDKRADLLRFRDATRHALETTHQYVPSDLYIRKVVDLYQVASRNVMTVLVGPSGSGKSTALDALSCIIMGQHADTPSGAATPESSSTIPVPPSVPSNYPKPVRLHPSAFEFKDIHGYFREDKSWCDGFITRFVKHHCEGPTHSRIGTSSLTSTATENRSQISTPPAFFSMSRGPVPATSYSPWLVLDGPAGLSTVEPLRTIINCDPSEFKVIQLPSGDQLHFKNDLLRVFCEVGDLSEWSPGTISRCGVLFFQGDLVTYTVLVKSWVRRHVETNPKYAKLASFMGKTARSILPTLLDICKRHMTSFSETTVPHIVSNFLQLLTSFLDQMAPDSSLAPSSDPPQAKVVIAYAAMLSLGLCIQGKAQLEFHDAVVAAIPDITAELGPGMFSSKERSIYDINLTFENQKVHLSVFEAPLPALADAYMSWNRPGTRRRSTFRRLSDGVAARGGLVGLGTSSLFVPTPRLLGYCAWMKSMLTAKLCVLVVGESAVGKTRLLDDVLSEMTKSNQFDVSSLQINRLKRGEDVLSVVENSLTRRMRGVYCPAVGKQALIVAIENLNLEAEIPLRAGGTARPCSEMIRQVCDAGGSFVKTSKEFVEFRDVAIAASFSLPPYGYPRLKARLLRHFHVMLMNDSTREVLRTVLATLPEQFLARLPQTTPYQASDIARLCRFPIETFHAVRKHLKPTPRTPHLLLSLNDVLRCLGRLMNVSVKSTETFADLENYTVFTTYQLFRSRMMDTNELSQLQAIGIAAARRLRYSTSSQSIIEGNFEFTYADYGDKAGSVRITSRAATALFIAADERFQWYNRAATKEAIQPEEQHVNGQSAPNSSAAPMGISPLPLMRKSSNVTTTNTTPETDSPAQGSVDPLALPIGTASPVADSGTAADGRRGSALVSANSRRQQVEKSTAASPATIQNMLDVLSFLQAGIHHLFICGAEPSKRRSATMIACGAQAFHFREVTSQLKLHEYTDQLKVPIMEAGLKASHTLIYVDCESLTPEELEVIVYVMLHFDLPPHLYSSSDKAKILAQEHQMRTFQQSHLRRPSVSSFFDDLTAVTSTRDGIIALPNSRKGDGHDPPQRPSSPPKKSVYRENLRRCLYLVLSFGRSTKMFDLIASYPTLYYQAGVKTFRFFDRNSLEAVYADTLGAVTPLNEALTRFSVSSDAIHDLCSLAVAIHEDAMRVLLSDGIQPRPEELGRRFRAARSRFEDFLGNLRTLFLYQKAKMTKLQDLVCKGLNLIEQDGEEANDQLSKSADGRVQLLEAGRAVIESEQKLKEHEATDRDARRAFVLDEQRCSALHSEVEHERELIQIELDKTLPDVAKATDALSQINKYHITEMKSFVNPPQLVRLAMQAVCVLLGVPPTWTEALRILADIHFLDRLRNFDKDRIDASLIERVKMYINHPDFSMENMKRASTASTTLCKWVLALVRYFEVMKRVAPTQKKLVHTEQQFREIDEMVGVERQKLSDLELQLHDLRSEHAKTVQREQELQRLYESKTKWKAEVIQFQSVVNKWARVLKKRAKRVKDQQFKLVGDCAVVAAACTYASSIPHDEREEVVSRWRELALTHLKGRPSRTSGATPSVSMPHSHSFLKSWLITGGVLREEFKRAVLSMELRGDEPLTINMLLMDQMQKISGRYPVLIDPLGRATSWLKQRYSSTVLKPSELGHDPEDHEEQELPADSNSGQAAGLHRTRHAAAFSLLHRFNIVLVDACDPKATELIEKRISHKTSLLIVVNHVAECEEASFHALLDVVAVASKKGGHTVIFSTTALDSMLSWKPKIWSQLVPIDCSPSETEIQDHILSRFLRHHWPSLEGDYDTACEVYVTERGKEDQVVHGFLECLQSISEDRDALSQPSSRPAASRDTSGKSFASEGGGLQDYEMSRITRCLEEYLSVKQKRQTAKRHLLDLRARRRQYGAIALRATTFVVAEGQLFCNFPTWAASLRWDTIPLVSHIEECIRENITPLSSSVHDGPDSSRVHGSMASMLGRITESFLMKRLSGLPANLHRAYRFLVATTIATSSNTPIDRAFVRNLLTPERVREATRFRAESGSGSFGSVNNDPATASEQDPIKHVANEYVRSVVASALRHVTRVPEDDVVDDLAVGGACRGLYRAINVSFVSASENPCRRRVLLHDLAQDMCADPARWLEFAQSPTIGVARAKTGEDAPDDYVDDAPVWVRQLSLLERFLLCLSVFRVVSVDMVEAVIDAYVGQERQHASKSAVDAFYNPGVRGVRPLVLHTNPQAQVCSPLSSITQYARLVGMREEMISFISMRSDTETHKLRLLREFHASGTWIVVYDVSSAGQTAFNSLRMALERLADMAPSNKAKTDIVHEFRMWILDPVLRNRLDGDPREHPDRTSRRFGVLCTNVFLGPPTEVRDCYDAFQRDEAVRKAELERQQQQQQQHDGNHHGSSQSITKQVSQRATPSPPSRKASNQPTIAYSSQLGADQMWIQVGLWIFHSLLRKQLSLGAPDGARSAPTTDARSQASTLIGSASMPLDLLASHVEVERAVRLVQLHQRQRTLASTMAAVSGLGGASLSSSSSVTEWTSMLELVSVVYTGKLPLLAMTPLMRDLLNTCLVLPSQQARSHWARASEWERRVLTLRDLVTSREIPASSALLDESPLMPHTLRMRSRMSDCQAALPQNESNRSLPEATHIVELVRVAQLVVQDLMRKMPLKHCLAVGVQRQEHQRRTSVFTAWRKHRPPEKPSRPPTAAQAPTPEIRYRVESPSWERAMLDHLLQIELPVMEAYVRHSWGLVEYLSSLKPETISARADALGDELGSTLEALCRQSLPRSWRDVDPAGQRHTPPALQNLRHGAKYPAPLQLDAWTQWLHKTVTFYQSVTNDRRVPEALPLSALAFPHACLLGVRHAIALDRGLSPDDLVLVVRHPTQNLRTPQSPPTGEAEVFASFQVTGLMLWNARWSQEAHGLQESVTCPPAQSDREPRPETLPTLTMDVTTHAADPGPALYRCPIFVSAASFVRLDEPIAHLFVPALDRASVFSACGVVMFVQADLDDLE